MSSQRFGFSLQLCVHDPQALFDAALSKALDNGLTETDALMFLKPKGEIDGGACLVQLLDPGSLAGCVVEDSSAEALASED